MVAFSARRVNKHSIYNKLSRLDRKTLQLQTAFTFYFLFSYYRFPLTNIPDLGPWWAKLSKKIPLTLMRTGRKSSLPTHNWEQSKGKSQCFVGVDRFIFRKIYLTNNKAESNWMREVVCESHVGNLSVYHESQVRSASSVQNATMFAISMQVEML